jgi:hypothetical protein
MIIIYNDVDVDHVININNESKQPMHVARTLTI